RASDRSSQKQPAQQPAVSSGASWLTDGSRRFRGPAAGALPFTDAASWALRSIYAIMTLHAHSLRWPHEPDTSSVTSLHFAKKLQRKCLSAVLRLIRTPIGWLRRSCGYRRRSPTDLESWPN